LSRKVEPDTVSAASKVAPTTAPPRPAVLQRVNTQSLMLALAGAVPPR
jgi:hypothetical protein